MSQIEVIPPGAKVAINDSLPGLVIAVKISASGVHYLVAWWSGRERHEEWLTKEEVSARSWERTRIGFVGK